MAYLANIVQRRIWKWQINVPNRLWRWGSRGCQSGQNKCRRLFRQWSLAQYYRNLRTVIIKIITEMNIFIKSFVTNCCQNSWGKKHGLHYAPTFVDWLSIRLFQARHFKAIFGSILYNLENCNTSNQSINLLTPNQLIWNGCRLILGENYNHFTWNNCL